MKKYFKFLFNIILIAVLAINFFKIHNTMMYYRDNKIIYKEAQKNKEKTISTHGCDWIVIPGTFINYPIMYGEGDDYYLKHNINGEPNKGGSIFYSELEEPLKGIKTVIYGHSMKDGSMFNNLHLFKEDQQKFENSVLYLENENEINEFSPLGYYVSNDNFFIYNLEDYTIDEAMNIIKENSEFYIDREYSESSHILALVTCEYSDDDNRLIVFYISN